MGSGKTTIGKVLAKNLGRSFIDMDQAIEEKLNLSVTEIFDQFGEARFRQEELKLAQELAKENKKVISTGGGAILNPELLDTLWNSGLLIRIHTSPSELNRRLMRSNKRPLLRGETSQERAQKIGQLIAEREAIYSQVKIIMTTDNFTPLRSAQKIETFLRGIPGSLARLNGQALKIS